MKTIEQLNRAITAILNEGDSKSLLPKDARKNKANLKMIQEAKVYLEFGATEESVSRQHLQLQEEINVIDQRIEDMNLQTSAAKTKIRSKYNLTQKRKQLKMLSFILSDAEAH